MSLFERIQKAFASVIGPTEAASMTPDATMEDVRSWDSSNFIALVLAIEDEFDIQMSTLDAASLTSVPSLMRYLTEKAEVDT